MGAVSEALKKLQDSKGVHIIKKQSVPLNADTLTKLHFLSELLDTPNETVAADLLTAAINQAWQELDTNHDFQLPSEEDYDKQLDSVIGKKKKVVKKSSSPVQTAAA